MLKVCLRVHTVEKSKLKGVQNQPSNFSLHCYYTHERAHAHTHIKKAEMYNISYIRQRCLVIGQYIRESNQTIFEAV